jgi:hypothetical protein
MNIGIKIPVFLDLIISASSQYSLLLVDKQVEQDDRIPLGPNRAGGGGV